MLKGKESNRNNKDSQLLLPTLAFFPIDKRECTVKTHSAGFAEHRKKEDESDVGKYLACSLPMPSLALIPTQHCQSEWFGQV